MPVSSVPQVQPGWSCLRLPAGARCLAVTHSFRGARLLGRTVQAPQQQQQQQDPQQQPLPGVKVLGFLSRVSVAEKQEAAEQVAGQQQHQQQQELEPADSGQDGTAAVPCSDYMALLSVSLLWGSYTPSLRYLYSMDSLLTPQVLTAHRTVISATALLVASITTYAVHRYQQHQRLQQQLREEQLQREREEQLRREREEQWARMLPTLLLNMLAPFGSSSTTTSSRNSSRSMPPLLSNLLQRSGTSGSNNSNSSGSSSSSSKSPVEALQQLLPWTQSSSSTTDASSSNSGTSSTDGTPSLAAAAAGAPFGAVLLAGLELGTWNFLATAAQACGLNLSTATKAAFLTQTTAVFTPCLAMLCGQAVLPAHWVACLAALIGSCCITLDSVGVAATPTSSSSSSTAVVAASSSSAAAQQKQVGVSLQPLAGPVAGVLQAPPVLAETNAADSSSSGVVGASSAGVQLFSGQSGAAAAAAGEVVAPAAAIGAQAELDVRQFSSATAAAPAVGPAGQSSTAIAPQMPGAAEQLQAVPVQQPPAATFQAGEGPAVVNSGVELQNSQVSALELQQQQQQQLSAVAEAHAALDAATQLPAPAASTSSSGVDGGSGAFDSAALVQDLATDTGAAVVAGAHDFSGSADSSVMEQQWELSQQQQQEQQVVRAQSGGDADTAPSTATTVASSSSNTDRSWGMTGEMYILLACCCYAIATVRLSMLAPGLDPVQLATSKTLTLAAASLCWLLAFGTGAEVAAEAASSGAAALAATGSEAATAAGAVAEATAVGDAFVVDAGGALGQLGAAAQSAAVAWKLPPAFEQGQGQLLLFYSALGPGALATVLQTKGQGTVAAAQAQVFYSLTPVWAALLASTCLQGEEMGPLAWIGGGVIIAASIGAAMSGSGGGGSSSSSSGSSGGSSGADGAADAWSGQ